MATTDCYKKCTLKDLTLKLTKLLALTSTARASKICFPDAKFLVKNSSGYILHFGKNIKTARQGKAREQVKFHLFREKKALSVCDRICLHCVKQVRIRSFYGPHFSAFGLNVERYGVSLRIQSECWKMRTRITPNTDTFMLIKPKIYIKRSTNF